MSNNAESAKVDKVNSALNIEQLVGSQIKIMNLKQKVEDSQMLKNYAKHQFCMFMDTGSLTLEQKTSDEISNMGM